MKKYIVVKNNGSKKIQVGDIFNMNRPFGNDTFHLFHEDGRDDLSPWMGISRTDSKLTLDGLSFAIELKRIS